MGVKKVLTDYLSIDANLENFENTVDRSDTRPNTLREAAAISQTGIESAGC